MIKLRKSDALYQQIASYFEKEIVEGRLRAGDRIPATTELATTFNVNADTIQQSLKLLMTRGLVERAPGRGTFVRRGINSKTIGIIFGKEIYTKTDMMFYNLFLDRLTILLEKKGWHYKLFSTSEFSGYDKTFYDLKTSVDSGEVKAVIEFCSSHLIKNWMKKECPVPYPQCPFSIDFAHLSTSGLNYLFRQDCRSFVLLAQVTANNLGDYQRTVKSFLAATGVPAEAVTVIPTRSRAADGYQTVKNIYRDKTRRPDGLLVANDAVFRGALYALLELGIKIPDDVKVITHANKGIDIFCHIPLTKLEVDPDAFVLQAFDEIMARIAGEKYRYTPVKPILVPGRSCGE